MMTRNYTHGTGTRVSRDATDDYERKLAKNKSLHRTHQVRMLLVQVRDLKREVARLKRELEKQTDAETQG